MAFLQIFPSCNVNMIKPHLKKKNVITWFSEPIARTTLSWPWCVWENGFVTGHHSSTAITGYWKIYGTSAFHPNYRIIKYLNLWYLIIHVIFHYMVSQILRKVSTGRQHPNWCSIKIFIHKQASGRKDKKKGYSHGFFFKLPLPFFSSSCVTLRRKSFSISFYRKEKCVHHWGIWQVTAR